MMFRYCIFSIFIIQHIFSGPAPLIPSEVWPAPVSFQTGSISLSICDSFTIACATSSLCPDPLPEAFDRYKNIIFFAGPSATAFTSALCALRIFVDQNIILSPTVNESYTLTIPADGSPAELHAVTQWGALRGLESFSQLVIWAGPDAEQGTYTITCAPIFISDSPRFTHRGVLLDTSFNFLAVNRILEVLDSMAVMKANIFHWHIVDDPAWPMVSSTFPSFTSQDGPYAQVATYSIDQQKLIADYAWKRGIMILLEFDVPGHAASWSAGGSDLVIACDGHQTLINPVGEIDDGKSVYSVLAGLLKEFYNRLGSPGLPLIHLGGDEVSDYTCWLNSSAVAAWALSLNISNDPVSVRTAFTSRVQDVANAAGLRPIFWEETFNGNFGVRFGSIVSPWVSTDVAGKATSEGYDVLNYAGYYLDQWVPPAKTNPDWYLANVSYAYVDSFRYLYAYDPESGVLSDSKGKVLGGVACAWGDNVDTSLGAVALLYPRALAIGEKLWSPAEMTRINNVQVDDDFLDSVAARMEHARCRLAQRGIGSSPVGVAGTYGFCWLPEWEENSNSSIDNSSLSPTALIASLIAAALGGAALTLLFVPSKRASAASWLSDSPSTVKGGGGGGDSSRMVALDQLRGTTMAAMLFVNLYYGRPGPLAPFFSHGITFLSGPDLVEPAFHFCVGFALRLVVLKRLSASTTTDYWKARWEVFQPLLFNRVAGLIILSMFVTEGWGQFDSFSELNGFNDWLTQLVQNRQPYHTLLHIAFITVWTFLTMTMNWKWRVSQLVGTSLLHALLHATFYFQWICTYTLDEGGYFGFIGWSIEALVGSLCYDVVIFARTTASVTTTTRSEVTEPLLDKVDQEFLLDTAAKIKAPKSAGGLNNDPDESRIIERAASFAGKRILLGAIVIMLLAYALSCLGASGPGILNPVCYDGQRIFFWGGFGAQVPCTGVPTIGNSWLVAPPFSLPDPANNVVTMWTMTQRAGSVTYHLFTAGTSAALFALFLFACEVGIPEPSWWHIIAGGASKILGIHSNEKSLRLKWHVAEIFGENALAIYLLGDKLGDQIGDMLPTDSPAWYFILWGEGLQFLIAYICAAYLRKHKLFLRL